MQIQLSSILQRLRKTEVMRRVHNARTNEDHCKQIHAHLDASLRGAALFCQLRGSLISSFSLPFGLSLPPHPSLCFALPTLFLLRFRSRVPPHITLFRSWQKEVSREHVIYLLVVAQMAVRAESERGLGLLLLAACTSHSSRTHNPREMLKTLPSARI